MKTLCVTGGNGLLGSKLLQEAQRHYHVVSVDIQGEPRLAFKTVEYIQCDITDRKKTIDLILKLRPDCIINTAAYTHVDGCETDREGAWVLNVEAAKNVALACNRVGCKLIHLSTDYVFDGENGPYSETDEPNPISVYGRTKWESEKIIQKILTDAVIARTMILYGYVSGIRPNFVTWLVNMLKRGERVRIVDDQYGNATLADDLAKALLVLYDKNKQGIYHTVGQGWMNRYELACKVANVFHLNAALIGRIKSDQFQQPAPRPLKSGLFTDKFYQETGYSFLSAEEGLGIMKKQMEMKHDSGKK